MPAWLANYNEDRFPSRGNQFQITSVSNDQLFHQDTHEGQSVKLPANRGIWSNLVFSKILGIQYSKENNITLNYIYSDFFFLKILDPFFVTKCWNKIIIIIIRKITIEIKVQDYIYSTMRLLA